MTALSDLPPILYYNHWEKDIQLSQGIMHGFDIKHWRPVGDAKCYPGDWIHMTNSLQHGSMQILKQCMDEGKPYIFLDNGYINNQLTSDWMKRMYRIVPNAFQHHWSPHIYAEDRYDYYFTEDIEQICRPWNYGRGDHVLLVPQSSWESNKIFGLDRWVHKMYDKIEKTGYKGEIRVRMKGHYRQPLELDLLNASACVCYTSNVAVDAIRLGVPTFCAEWSAARPMCFDLAGIFEFEKIINSYTKECGEPDRIPWLQGLMCGQFTHTEISNGFAKEMVLNEMIRRMDVPNTLS